MIKEFVLLLLIAGSLSAQEFGFGFSEDGTSGSDASGGKINVSVNGSISSSMTGYYDDFSESLEEVKLGDIFSGTLEFSAAAANAEGKIVLNLEASESPVSVDEAYLRAFFGKFEIVAGLRKLTWGKADSFGPLDVINPLDSSEIYTTMADKSDLMETKIARPLVHASYRFGQFSKIEGVFVPNFEPHRYATNGRWAPAQLKELDDMLALAKTMGITLSQPNISALEYVQAGLRFTTSIGPVDFGVQYYYGRLPQQSVKVIFDTQNPAASSVSFLYNPYHQIGLDYAQVLFDFNLRAELAANITGDLKGDDGSVYNPSIAWSFGFDRDVVLGINLNLQVNESIRLMHDKLGSGDMMSAVTGRFDIEGGSPLTTTRITATLSKRFLRDELELRAASVWGIEDKDCLIMPAVIWTKDDICIALSCGFFAGGSDGQLGQYKDNNFLKMSMIYTF